jgi:hypothetical protein
MNQNLILINEIINIIIVNITNLKKWLFVWNKTFPPSVEYMVARLMKPKSKIQAKRM